MTYILREPSGQYFAGTMNGGEDVVLTWKQSHALRFRDRDLAELAMVGHCPNADVVRLRKRSTEAKPGDGDTHT